MDYYKNQLEKLNESGHLSIKVFSDGESTKQMDINPESAKILIEWLTKYTENGL